MTDVRDELEKMILEEKDLIENAANRVPICLCVDASYSMILDYRMKQANDGIRQFIVSIRNNFVAADATDLCVISFGGKEAKVEIPFQAASKIEYHDIAASGQTPLGGAVQFAMEAIDTRLEQYACYGIMHYKPWLILISDGEATDDITAAAAELLKRQRDGKMKVLCIGLGDEANSLAAFQINGEVTKIQKFELDNFFKWLSTSVARISTQSPYEDIDNPMYSQGDAKT